MGIKTFFSARSSRRARDESLNFDDNKDNNTTIATNNKTGPLDTPVTPVGRKPTTSERIALGFCKAFHIHRSDDSLAPGSANVPASPLSGSKKPKPLYRFQSPKQKTKPAPSPASTSNLTVFESDAAPPCGSDGSPTAPGSETPPPSRKHVDTVAQLLRDAQSTEVSTRPTRLEEQPNELEVAMAGMRAAEKLLQQRHTVMKPESNIGKKMKPLESLIKKASPKGNNTVARLPADTSPSARPREQSKTANEACEALQRRQLIKKLVFDAAEGCPNAIAIIDRVNAHSAFKFNHPDVEAPDLTFDFDGILICTGELSSVERNWITRYNALINNITLVERRLMSTEDHEAIVTQLFPEERGHILKPEHFEIFMTGLGEEGILTKSQAKAIARLGVTLEEFEKGAHFTGPSKNANVDRYNPGAVAIFDIPKQASRGVAYLASRPNKTEGRDLYYHLRILVEAAVYDQKFWKGYFFPNARSKLNDFYQAYKVSQEGWLLPPNLTDYQRPWTHRELRLLQRGQMLCTLLNKYETGDLTDFGIIRATRGTYVQIPAQPFFGIEDLESFLYHRLPDSGLAISQIPDILALHPENDTAFANPRLRTYITKSLQERAAQFEKEEEQRLSEIETSYTTFESARKAQMTVWQRFKACWKKVCGKEEVVVPFDPFAPEHRVGGWAW